MTTQPTPQPAGDAAIAQAFRNPPEMNSEQAILWQRINQNAAEIETARAIQAGKGAPVRFHNALWKQLPAPQRFYASMLTQVWQTADSTELAEACKAGVLAIAALAGSHPTEDAAATYELAHNAGENHGRIMSELEQAHAAGSQGEGVGAKWRWRSDDDGSTTRWAPGKPKDAPNGWHIEIENTDWNRKATNPDPAAPDGDDAALIEDLRTQARENFDSGCCNASFPIASNRRLLNTAADRIAALSDQRVGEAGPQELAYVTNLDAIPNRATKGSAPKEWWGVPFTRKERSVWALGYNTAVANALAAPPAAIPDGMVVVPDSRAQAEHVYTMQAFDYESAPVGSRDWVLFYNGWVAARSTSQDTARMDWLESNVVHYGDGYTEPREANIGWNGWQQHKGQLTFPGLRSAIDDAIAAAPGSAEGG